MPLYYQGVTMNEPATWASKALFWSPASCVAFCQPTNEAKCPPEACSCPQNTVSLSCLLTPPCFKHCITLYSPMLTSAQSPLSCSRISPLHNGHAIKIIEQMNTGHFPELLPHGPATHSFQAALPRHKDTLFHCMEEWSSLVAGSK